MSTDERLEERSRELLRDSVDRIEGRVRSRLTQARYAAVEAARFNRTGALWRAWVPAGGVAAAAVLAVLLWNARDNGQQELTVAATPAGAISPMDDLDLLMASESFELLEDLEFYDWLDSELPDTEREVG